MKVKLEAGASLDLLTKDEVGEVLRSWHEQVRAGVKYPLFAAQGIVRADNSFTIEGDALGPGESFMWDVRRLAIGGDTLTNVNVYINEASPARRVCALTGDRGFNPVELVLNFGSRLVITGTGTVPGAQITISGQAKEVPYLLGWSL